MIAKCQEITKLECPVVFEADEDFVVGQMIAHVKGSHNIVIGRDDVIAPTPATEEVVVEETTATVDWDSMTVRELKKQAKLWGVYKARMTKKDLVKALENA